MIRLDNLPDGIASRMLTHNGLAAIWETAHRGGGCLEKWECLRRSIHYGTRRRCRTRMDACAQRRRSRIIYALLDDLKFSCNSRERAGEIAADRAQHGYRGNRDQRGNKTI